MQKYVDLVSNNNPVPMASWPGGRAVLITRATAYGAAQLQFQLQDQTWVNVGAASAADGISAGMDLPSGNYRLNTNGAQTGMYAQLQSISYS